MTRYRRRARIDADRFGYVRNRERFLYEDPYDDWHRSEWEHGNFEPRHPVHTTNDLQRSIGRGAGLAIWLLLLAASVILGALLGANYTGNSLVTYRVAETQTTPPLASALPAPASNNIADPACAYGGCDQDARIAEIAWQYFENNFHPETGLVNSVDGIESTTLWDTGSSIAAFITARDFNFISQHDFDHSVMSLLQTLAKIDLVNDVAPNLLYHTRSAKMVDYDNQITDTGIGASTIDLARAAFWLNTLQCFHPKYYNPVHRVLERWKYGELFKNGEIYGLAVDPQFSERASTIQQGRFGFEQYAGRIFKTLGHATDVSASYENANRGNTEVLGLRIAHDQRDPRETGVNNFVLTDSYTLDAMELGVDAANSDLLQAIYNVQRERWRRTGIATALTDGHLNQSPYFLYNTIFDAGLSFTTTTDTGIRLEQLRTISTRAAMMLATLFPQDPYSDVLNSSIESAYDPKRGWFSGVFENGGFNDVTSANTNGIILQTMLYKKYGVLNNQCSAQALSHFSAEATSM